MLTVLALGLGILDLVPTLTLTSQDEFKEWSESSTKFAREMKIMDFPSNFVLF